MRIGSARFDGDAGPRRPPPMTARAWGIVVAVALVATLVAVSPRRLPRVTVDTEPPVVQPESFAAWPPLVLTWRVRAAAGTVASALEAGFGRDPCGPLGRSECWVRLAWSDFDRWSLTASPDPEFDVSDPRQLTAGPLHYGMEGGVVLGVLDTDRLPGLHACHGLLTEPAGDVAVAAAAPWSGWRTWRLEAASGDSARCVEPWGAPLDMTLDGTEWRHVVFELREPLPAELAADLARGYVAPPHRCDSGIDAAAGLDLVDVADVSGLRPALAWVSDADPELLPTGTRRRQVDAGLVVDEIVGPIPAVSVAVGDERLWLSFGDELAGSPGRNEREVFVLGEAVRRLAPSWQAGELAPAKAASAGMPCAVAQTGAG